MIYYIGNATTQPIPGSARLTNNRSHYIWEWSGATILVD
jgi:hypothetical protein